ncbi:hypothetical protein B0H11DRAFT_2028675 [Mycena galericulata]|nr:hypothetical protein B0H11DRAFT_2028675 [Mycena galericulata]
MGVNGEGVRVAEGEGIGDNDELRTTEDGPGARGRAGRVWWRSAGSILSARNRSSGGRLRILRGGNVRRGRGTISRPIREVLAEDAPRVTVTRPWPEVGVGLGAARAALSLELSSVNVGGRKAPWAFMYATKDAASSGGTKTSGMGGYDSESRRILDGYWRPRKIHGRP